MELTSLQQETIRHQFDCFCKRVLRGEACDYFRQLARRSQREKSLSELSEEQMEGLRVLDTYPSDGIHFEVQGYDIAISDEKLADHLFALPDDRRDIVLLSYFLNMTDQEVANELHIARSTVQYRRTSSLRRMKQGMEVREDGEASKE